jgi:hypothetical protein
MNKIIVFDLDETIGDFSQIIHIMNVKQKNTKKEVHELFDLFPCVFRTNLFEVFHYIARLKRERRIHSVLLYTNNACELFIDYVLSYIHDKLNYTLFDVTISYNQTQKKNKNLVDLLHYSKLNPYVNYKICFIDDTEYDEMKSCYYIHCERYTYDYSTQIKKLGIDLERNKKIKISQSVYALITKEMLHKIKCFVMVQH